MALNLKAQCAESGVLVWASTQRPMKLAIGGQDWEFIDTRVSGIHQPQIIEFPILVPIGTVPVAGVIVIFIGKSNSNPVLPECPQFLDEPIIQLPGPFALGCGMRFPIASSQLPLRCGAGHHSPIRRIRRDASFDVKYYGLIGPQTSRADYGICNLRELYRDGYRGDFLSASDHIRLWYCPRNLCIDTDASRLCISIRI